MLKKKTQGFLGQGWSFPPDFSMRTQGVEMCSAEEDIKQSLHILFSTQFGERVMQPQYGCDLRSMVFENLDSSAITFIKDTMETAIIYHEPRIKLITIYAKDQLDTNGALVFDIHYQIRTTNTRNNLVYPFHLSEANLQFFKL